MSYFYTEGDKIGSLAHHLYFTNFCIISRLKIHFLAPNTRAKEAKTKQNLIFCLIKGSFGMS